MTKSEIITFALSKLQSRIEEVEQQIVQTEKSQAEDSKSSAGDKFETGRERLQQELDRLGEQLSYLQDQRMALTYLERSKSAGRDVSGSLFTLKNGMRYLVATGFGKLKLADESEVFIVSLESPIGQALIGRIVGETFDFRGTDLELIAIE